MQDRLLYEIAKSLHEQHLDPHRTLQTLLSRTGQALDTEYGCLMTFTDTGNIDHVYLLGVEDTPEIRNRTMWQKLFKKGIIGYVYHSNRQIVVRNVAADPRYPRLDAADFFPKSGSAIGLPIPHHDKVYGVLVFVHNDIDFFTDERVTFLTEIGELAAHALANTQQAKQANQPHVPSAPDPRYYAIFEHTPVPVVLTDSEGIIVDANFKACEFLGFKRGVLQGIPLGDVNVVSVKDMGELEYNQEKFLPTNAYDIDGNAIPTLIRARKIELDGQDYIEWIMQDISVQQELENLRRDLTAMIYHDLRGPLGSIHMAINKLGELLQGHENPAVLKIMQLALRSTQQVSRLVDTLLDVQRLEQGSSILNLRPSEIHTVLSDALQLVMPNAESSSISIDLDIVRSPLVEIDSDMITRVVINLMENAIKYTPDNGKMTVRAEQVENDLKITVSDTGPGIPEQMRKSIFDKFSRVKYQDAPKGVGLGLAFCRLAIEAHHGRIWVESDGENGSDFIFTLPIAETPKSDDTSTEEQDEETPLANAS